MQPNGLDLMVKFPLCYLEHKMFNYRFKQQPLASSQHPQAFPPPAPGHQPPMTLPRLVMALQVLACSCLVCCCSRWHLNKAHLLCLFPLHSQGSCHLLARALHSHRDLWDYSVHNGMLLDLLYCQKPQSLQICQSHIPG